MKVVSRLSLPRSAYLDAFLIGAILIVVNLFVDYRDFGLLKLTPSPFFLLPVLLGARYGFGAGVAGGLLASFWVVGGKVLLLQLSPRDVILPNAFLLASLVISGALTGEIQIYFQRMLDRSKSAGKEMEARIQRMGTNLNALRDSRDELERTIATKDNGFLMLNTEIRRLYTYSEKDRYRALLLIMSRQTKATEASCFLVEPESDQMEKVACIGSEDALPTNLGLHDIDMIRLAIRQKSVVSVPDVWDMNTGDSNRCLIAQPLVNSSGEVLAVIAITALPFSQMNENTVRAIEVIANLATQVIEVTRGDESRYRLLDGLSHQKIFLPEAFETTLRLSYDYYLQHRISSSVVVFSIPGGDSEMQVQLERSVHHIARDGDYVTAFNSEFPKLAVFLPLTGERDCQTFIERCVKGFDELPDASLVPNYRFYTFSDVDDFEVFWSEISSDPTADVLKVSPSLSREVA
jgi:hypothetical protein